MKEPEKHSQLIYDAIVTGGYRMIDTATYYDNEAIVGDAIQRAINDGHVTRGDIFIVTKLWMTDFHDPEAAIRLSLQKLKTDYVDLYLIHWPTGFFNAEPEKRVPVHVLYRQLEAFQEQGLTRSLGVSNFNLQMLADLLCYCRVKPVCNEVELNPSLVQADLVKFMKAQSIVPIAYTPVSRLGERANEHLQNANFVAICERHSKSQAQVMLNWAVARGTIPIPRSGSLNHVLENIAVYDFKLSDEEMSQIDALNSGTRVCDGYFGGGVSFFC